jgi:hypothetical protein
LRGFRIAASAGVVHENRNVTEISAVADRRLDSDLGRCARDDILGRFPVWNLEEREILLAICISTTL